MKSKVLFMALLLAVVLVSATADCPINVNGNLADTIAEIRYSFRDGSVAPEYHRSYTITATVNSVSVVVNSYANILADEQYDITAQQFGSLAAALQSHAIRNCSLGAEEDCVGGSRETISYSDGESEIFSGSVSPCVGQDWGDLCGDVDSFADAMKALVPDFEQLLE